jgi:hypothetical protein
VIVKDILLEFSRGFHSPELYNSVYNSHIFAEQVPGEADQRGLYLPLKQNSSSEEEEYDSCSMYIDPSNHSLGTTTCKVSQPIRASVPKNVSKPITASVPQHAR